MADLAWAELSPHLSGLAHLATADPDAVPHVAVVAPMIEDGIVWLCTRRSSKKARNLAANPAIALMWSPGPEVYLRGRAGLVDDLGEKERIWHSGRLSFDPAAFFGSPDNPDFVLVRVEPTSAVLLEQTGRRTWRR